MFRKTFKRLFTAVVALVMAFAVATPAFAASNGTITISDAVNGQTYSIYKILDLESYDKENNHYAYKATNEWRSWLEGMKSYVSVSDDGYVTWIGDETDTAYAAFAQAALAHAKTVTDDGVAIAPTKSEEATGDTISFTDLDLGWYLVDSSLGALCNLTTTKPDANIEEKNAEPTVDKEIVSASDGNEPSVGDTVQFKATIHAKKGAENYVFHDKMDSGLEWDGNATVTVDGVELPGNACDLLAYNLGDGCTFHISFTKDYLKTINENTDIIITYSATITEKAVDVDSVKNEAKLTFGDGNSTTSDFTQTSVYQFGLFKSDESGKALSNAKFELFDDETAGSKIPLVSLGDGSYRVASADERSEDSFDSAVIITPESGAVTICGLGSGTYWLEEIEAPAGYNRLSGRVSVSIDDADNNLIFDEGFYKDGGVHVVNKTGSELPSTGGMGTTVLYIVGGALVVGAGITLVVRRRMSAEA